MKIRRPWTLLAVAGALGFLILKFTVRTWSAAIPPCSFRSMTGLYCPGCGGTRSAKGLLRGDLGQALEMNPLVVVLFLAGCSLLGLAMWREWRRPQGGMPLIPGWFAWTLASLVVVFGLVRNLPWWPFTLLVPH